MMNQKIKLTPVSVDSDFAKSMQTWLESKAKDLKSSEIYLLSFHDDGVVWGKVENDVLKTSDFAGSPSPEFRTKTLQELRLFGEKGQLHVWRVGEGMFKASLALDNEEGKYEFLEFEEQVLHGTFVDKGGNENFTIVRDGEEGLRHAFPKQVDDYEFKVKDEKGNIAKDKNDKEIRHRPLRLKVNHYIEYDQDGCARIAYSRLVNIGCGLDLGELDER